MPGWRKAMAWVAVRASLVDKVTFKVAVIRSCALDLQTTSVDRSLDYNITPS